MINQLTKCMMHRCHGFWVIPAFLCPSVDKEEAQIKRVFPWTIETQHDANVLRTSKTIFDGIDGVMKSLPKIDGIEMFRPDSRNY